MFSNPDTKGSMKKKQFMAVYLVNIAFLSRTEQRGRREVTGHLQMRVESEEEGGMKGAKDREVIEEEDTTVPAEGRGEREEQEERR